MKIRVQITSYSLRQAHVSLSPSWLERWLLGRREQDFLALALPGLSGGLEWYADVARPYRITHHGVLAAIERARKEADRKERKLVTAQLAVQRWTDN